MTLLVATEQLQHSLIEQSVILATPHSFARGRIPRFPIRAAAHKLGASIGY